MMNTSVTGLLLRVHSLVERLPGIAALKQHKLRTLAAAAAVAIAAIWFSSEDSDAPAAVTQSALAIPVQVGFVRRADIPLYLEGLGTVQAFNTVTVTTRVDGQLQSVNFIEGQEVKQGDTLAQIDPRPYQAAYDQALATKAKDAAMLANARLDLQRYQNLASQNAIATQMLDAQRATVAQLTAQVAVDQAAIDSAKTNLDYTTIRSPIEGRAGIRQVDMGNNLSTTANTTVVVITQLQPVSVIFSLPEENLPGVSDGMAAGSLGAIAVARDNKTELDRGNTVVLDNEVNQTTGTLKLKATFPNTHERLWPGDFVNVKLLVRTEKNVLTVPAPAVQRGPDGQFVYVVKPDSTVAIRRIALVRFTDNAAVIAGGLRVGEVVVTTGQYRLQGGAHVQLPRTELAQLAATRTRALRAK
jgi:multidrug efflux system membrane fusion protein